MVARPTADTWDAERLPEIFQVAFRYIARWLTSNTISLFCLRYPVLALFQLYLVDVWRAGGHRRMRGRDGRNPAWCSVG